MSSSGHVRGASTPFQFRRPSADDFVAIEDEDEDIMIIKSKTAALEENLALAEKEKDKLKKVTSEGNSILKKLLGWVGVDIELFEPLPTCCRLFCTPFPHIVNSSDLL